MSHTGRGLLSVDTRLYGAVPTVVNSLWRRHALATMLIATFSAILHKKRPRHPAEYMHRPITEPMVHARRGECLFRVIPIIARVRLTAAYPLPLHSRPFFDSLVTKSLTSFRREISRNNVY